MRKSLALILCLSISISIMSFLFVNVNSNASIKKVKGISLVVNNKKVATPKTLALQKSGNSFLAPAKKTSAAMKLQYSFNKKTKKLTLKKKKKSVILSISKKTGIYTYKKSRKSFRLKLRTVCIRKNPMFDLLTVSAKFGYKYWLYNQETKTFYISNKKSLLPQISDVEQTSNPHSSDVTGTVATEVPSTTDAAGATENTNEKPEATPTPKPYVTVVPTTSASTSTVYSCNFDNGETLFTEFYGDAPQMANINGGAEASSGALQLTAPWLTCRSFPSMRPLPNSKYKVSMYIKGNFYNAIIILPNDTRYTICSYENAPEIADWQKVEYEFETDENIDGERKFEFRVMTGGSGSIYLDQLVIEQTIQEIVYVTITPSIEPGTTPNPPTASPTGTDADEPGDGSYTPVPTPEEYPTMNIDANDGKSGTTYAYRTTGLPVCFINTKNGVNPTTKDQYQKATMCIEETGDSGVWLLAPTSLSIAIRGNSTSGPKKKPYKVKFTDNADGTKNRQRVLGMSAHHKWNFLANQFDKTLLHNAVAMNLGRQLSGLDYTTDFRFVELVVNGKYVGNYMITEKVEIANNRIDITKSSPNGKYAYVLELDQRIVQSWYVQYYGSTENVDYIYAPLFGGTYPLKFKDPDPTDLALDTTKRQFIIDDAKKTWTALSTAVNKNDFEKNADLDSFMDFYFAQEFCKPIDGYSFSSIFMHKDSTDDAKMMMGPLWDFDLGFGNTDADAGSSGAFFTAPYASVLRKLFMPELTARWKQIKPMLQSQIDYVDTMSKALEASAALNYKLWPINDNSSGEMDSRVILQGSYAAEINALKSYMSKRITYIDSFYP